MEDDKTNFDRYLERKLQDAGFAPVSRRLTRPGILLCSLPPAPSTRARPKTSRRAAGHQTTSHCPARNPRYTGHSLSMVRKYVEALGPSLDVTIIPAETTGAYAAQRSPKPLLTQGG